MRVVENGIIEAGVAIMGYGVVGKGVAHAVRQNASIVEKKTGVRLKVLRILDLLDFPDSPDAALITHDLGDILNDPGVDVVVETMGGLGAAYKFTKEALANKKHVVTSNKELVAGYGPELLEAAALNGVRYCFDASVGGGIPVVNPIEGCLAANDIDGITGILNGTTNYMLTYMKSHGAQFGETLKKAQENGYAEYDPSADIDGGDACRKLAILSSTAFGAFVDWRSIHTEGIRNVLLEDIVRAADLGRVLKLIARIKRTAGNRYEAYVLPAMIDRGDLLARVDGVFNGVVLHGDLTGDVMFYGQGAGMLPTGSAIVADVAAIAAEFSAGSKRGFIAVSRRWNRDSAIVPVDFSTYSHGYYVRVKTPDRSAYVDQLFRQFTEARLLPQMPAIETPPTPAVETSPTTTVETSSTTTVETSLDIDSSVVVFTVPKLAEGDFAKAMERLNNSVEGSETGFVARLIEHV